MASLDDLADLSDEELSELPDPPSFPLPRLPWWAVAGLVLLVLMVALVLYGEVNTQRYYLVCKAKTAEAHQGRGFPWPFGHSALSGPQYRSVPLGPEAVCEPMELDSEDQLQQSLLELLVVELDRLRLVTRLTEVHKARRLLTQGFSLARGERVAVSRLRALKAHFDLQEGLLVLRGVERSLLEAQRLLQAARRGIDDAESLREGDSSKVGSKKAGDSGKVGSKKAGDSGKAGSKKVGDAENPREEEAKTQEEARKVDQWLALVSHLLERLQAGSAPEADPRVQSPIPPTLPTFPIPTRAMPAPDAGLWIPDALAPRPATGLEPPRNLAPEEPPQPALPILPDAGVQGGGILL